LKVDASRGQNDPRKPAKRRRAWRGLVVSPAGSDSREAKSWGGCEPYEQNVQPADVGAKTRSAAATQRPACWRGVKFCSIPIALCAFSLAEQTKGMMMRLILGIVFNRFLK